MSTELLEQKVAELERRLEAVESRTEGGNGSSVVSKPERTGSLRGPSFEAGIKDSWIELFGWSKDDTLLRDAARSGAEWRERMNREGK